MSGQAIANPEEIEQFARNLVAFNGQLQDDLSRLRGQLQRLGETWRDAQHDKFLQEFQHTERQLHQFMRATNEEIPLLVEKARILREYLNR